MSGTGAVVKVVEEAVEEDGEKGRGRVRGTLKEA